MVKSSGQEFGLGLGLGVRVGLRVRVRGLEVRVGVRS
jgi:hypothetical protein